MYKKKLFKDAYNKWVYISVVGKPDSTHIHKLKNSSDSPFTFKCFTKLMKRLQLKANNFVPLLNNTYSIVKLLTKLKLDGQTNIFKKRLLIKLFNNMSTTK